MCVCVGVCQDGIGSQRGLFSIFSIKNKARSQLSPNNGPPWTIGGAGFPRTLMGSTGRHFPVRFPAAFPLLWVGILCELFLEVRG